MVPMLLMHVTYIRDEEKKKEKEKPVYVTKQVRTIPCTLPIDS